jgi:hypothetical protein
MFALILISGCLYVCTVLFQDFALVRLFGVYPSGSATYVRNHALQAQAASLALQLPSLLLLLVASSTLIGRALRAALRIPSLRVIGLTSLITILISLGLNATAAWPFTWRWKSSGAASYAYILLSSKQWLTVGLWAASGIVVTPLVEEVLIRFGLLRALLRTTRSRVISIIGSSAVFAVGHLGSPVWAPDVAHFTNASWLFGVSLCLGYVTLRMQGNIVIPLAAHITRNALELVSLFAATR